MSAKFTDKQLADLLDGIADGLPIGSLAGIVGVSSPTIANRLNDAAFLQRIAETVKEYDAGTVALLERLEHWWNYPGERPNAYRLRQSVAKAIRSRFRDRDEAEKKAARRKGRTLRRGGIEWRWNADENRWELGKANWWRGSIGG